MAPMPDLTLDVVEDPDGLFSVAFPPGWEVAWRPTDGVALVALEPELVSPLRANLVVTLSDVPMSFAEWQKGTDVLLPRTLEQYDLIDLQRLELAGAPAGRRLAHHTVDGNAATMEQWSILQDGRGYTLTFTVPTMRYGFMVEGLRVIAASFRPGPTPEGTS